MDLMDNSSYLENIFQEYRTVSILTRNGKWRRDFYLPQIADQSEKVMKVIFDIQSTSYVNVHFEAGKIELGAHTKTIFWNDNGTWRNKKGKINFKTINTSKLVFKT